ncbi:MAG TPA: M56 family metallopeptidase [Candidatus Limnocylindrales bacterium]|nr:M56 family metallopeptidase [Candidatus Limnocylindrales bacterium]
MTLPYILRLLLISSAIMFLVHAIVGLCVRLVSPAIIRFSRKFRPRVAARLLLFVRLVPFGLASIFVFGFCVPSYLWFEPGATTERVGLACILAGFLGISLCSQSFFRAFRAVLITRKYTRSCLKGGRELLLSAESASVVIVESEVPILAMAGVIRPRLVVSQGVLNSLSHDQLAAAVRHERAHLTSADNLKRLLVMFSPEIFPFVHAFSPIEQAWKKTSEWAADDSAVENDALRSLSLASALIRVAQLGAPPRLSPLCTALVSGDAANADSDLADRVDRLLHPAPAGNNPPKRWANFVGCSGIAMGLLVMIAASRPSTLYSVYQLLERLIH